MYLCRGSINVNSDTFCGSGCTFLTNEMHFHLSDRHVTESIAGLFILLYGCET